MINMYLKNMIKSYITLTDYFDTCSRTIGAGFVLEFICEGYPFKLPLDEIAIFLWNAFDIKGEISRDGIAFNHSEPVKYLDLINEMLVETERVLRNNEARAIFESTMVYNGYNILKLGDCSLYGIYNQLVSWLGTQKKICKINRLL